MTTDNLPNTAQAGEHLGRALDEVKRTAKDLVTELFERDGLPSDLTTKATTDSFERLVAGRLGDIQEATTRMLERCSQLKAEG
ncbi:MAG TPA: hypothetical protein VFZ48_00115 [Candidatus Saccharimonadales bacterium]